MDFIYDKLDYCITVLNSLEVMDKPYKVYLVLGSCRSCPVNYTCLPDAGPNPDHGYTNFDHMGWSLVMSFQILTMDFWENIYNKVLGTIMVVLVLAFRIKKDMQI